MVCSIEAINALIIACAKQCNKNAQSLGEHHETETCEHEGATALIVSLSNGANEQSLPYRDITTAVVWDASGGTGTIKRLIMAEMKNLPVSINVINQTGGATGSNGMVYVQNQHDDGSTLGRMSVSNVAAAVQGGFDIIQTATLCARGF